VAAGRGSLHALFDNFMNPNTPRTNAQPKTWENRTMASSYTTVPKRWAETLEIETNELKELLRMAIQYLPSRDEAPGFRGRIDEALSNSQGEQREASAPPPCSPI
jgi:hypothetical protein